MQYTATVVDSILAENVQLKERILCLERRVKEKEREAEEAHNKYAYMAEKCIEVYVSKDGIVRDTITVEAVVPNFMSQEDFSMALNNHIIRMLTAERSKLGYD